MVGFVKPLQMLKPNNKAKTDVINGKSTLISYKDFLYS